MRLTISLLVLMVISTTGFAQANRSSSSNSDATACIADARWTNTNGSVMYSRQMQAPISLSLLTHISKGSGCSRAEVRLTATFLTDTQDFICSGTLAPTATVTSDVQVFNFDIRPFTQSDFLRWRNEPGTRGMAAGKHLSCYSVDGSADLGDTQRVNAGWIHLAVSVFPPGGGLAVVEAVVRINP